MDNKINVIVKEEPNDQDQDQDVIFVGENVPPNQQLATRVKEEAVTDVKPVPILPAGELRSEIVAFYQGELDKKDFALNMAHFEKGQLANERDELLKQLEREISKSAALIIDAENNQKSYDAVVKRIETENQLALEDLSNQRDLFHMRMHELEESLEKKEADLEKIMEEQTCSICLCPWEAQGSHRLMSLACGHLFGDSCIRSHMARNPFCPYCKHPIQPSALRYIFGCRIQPRTQDVTTGGCQVLVQSTSNQPSLHFSPPQYQVAIGPPTLSAPPPPHPPRTIIVAGPNRPVPSEPIAPASSRPLHAPLSRPVLAPPTFAPALAPPTLGPALAPPTLAPEVARRTGSTSSAQPSTRNGRVVLREMARPSQPFPPQANPK